MRLHNTTGKQRNDTAHIDVHEHSHLSNEISNWGDRTNQEGFRHCVFSQERAVFENVRGKEAKDQPIREGDNAKQHKLEQDPQRRPFCEYYGLEAQNCIEQNDRDDIVDHTFTKDTAEELWLQAIVDDAHRGDNIWTTE